jgi:hypothetical protein
VLDEVGVFLDYGLELPEVEIAFRLGLEMQGYGGALGGPGAVADAVFRQAVGAPVGAGASEPAFLESISTLSATMNAE